MYQRSLSFIYLLVQIISLVYLLSITADNIVKLLEEDVRARKRLAELLVSEPDVRLSLINAVLRDVATRSDIDKLYSQIETLRRDVYSQISELRERVSKLEGVVFQLAERIGDLDKRIDSLDKRIDALDKRINALDKRIDALDRRIDALDKRIDSLDKRIDGLDKRMDYVARISWLLAGSVIATLIAQILIHTLLK